MTSESASRIVVALDASPHSIAALRAAAELAAALDAELEGIFVEDINLVHLGGFPFGHEVGSLTAVVRRLDNQSLERQLRSLAEQIRADMQRTLSSQVRWSFQVRRGPVADELLAAARDVALLSLGRSSRRRRRSLGSTAQAIVQRSTRPVLLLDEDGRLKLPFTVVFTGSPASLRALDLAVQLAQRSDTELSVLLWPRAHDEPDALQQMHEQVERRLAPYAEDIEVTQEVIEYNYEFQSVLRGGRGGTLLLPGEQARLLTQQSGPIILVP